MTDLRIAKDRLLYMYSRLVDGKMLYKKEEPNASAAPYALFSVT